MQMERGGSMGVERDMVVETEPTATEVRPEAQLQAGTTRILYDPVAINAPTPEWLDPEFWRAQSQVIAELGGRGQALLVETPAGPAVLRRFMRGGQMARISRDRYLFTGYQRSRAFREWRLLSCLRTLGLPVPAPLVASCERLGGCYRAALMTRYLPNSRSLAQVGNELDSEQWQALGDTLERFFRAGLLHADLNAHNLLIDESEQWHVIDFDRGRIGPAPSRPGPMLKRLERSLDKLAIDGERGWLRRLR